MSTNTTFDFLTLSLGLGAALAYVIFCCLYYHSLKKQDWLNILWDRDKDLWAVPSLFFIFCAVVTLMFSSQGDFVLISFSCAAGVMAVTNGILLFKSMQASVRLWNRPGPSGIF